MLDYCLKPILKRYDNNIIIYDNNEPCFRIDEYNYTYEIIDVIKISYVIYYFFSYFLVIIIHLIYIYSFYLIDFRNNLVHRN